MARARDSQRKKFYAAIEGLELAEPAGSLTNSDGLYRTEAEAQAVIDRVIRTRWWRYHDAQPPTTVQVNATANLNVKFVGAGSALLLLPAHMRRSDFDLLRALAWVMIPRDAAWHGVEYCSTLLQLVARFIDLEQKNALKRRFVEHRVKHIVRGNRTITPEQKAVLIARAAEMRERRVERNIERLEEDYVV